MFLYTPNEPVIESSDNLKFAPYNVGYPLLDKHAESIGFDVNTNKWDLIFDFTKNDKRLNFEFLDPSEFRMIIKEIPDLEGSPQPTAPFARPEKYGGNLDNDANKDAPREHDGLMAFTLGTSPEEARKQMLEIEAKLA